MGLPLSYRVGFTETSVADALDECLTTLCAWAREIGDTRGAAAAVVSAVQAGSDLPEHVRCALEKLERFEGHDPGALVQDLTAVFEELEATASFNVFQRRLLLDGSRPTRRELAKELGITSERVRQLERQGERVIRRCVKEDSSPLRLAASRLRSYLGPVARPLELTDALKVITEGGKPLEGISHRGALIQEVAGYCVVNNWLLDPHIQDLTTTLLTVLTEPGPADLDIACQRLAPFGVRIEFQIPWIAAQSNFRISGGQVKKVPLDPVCAAASLLANANSDYLS